MDDSSRSSRRRSSRLSALAGSLSLAGALATMAASAWVLVAPRVGGPGPLPDPGRASADAPLPDGVLVPEILGIRDAAPVGTGAGWMVLDGGGHRIHRLAPDRSVVASFGGEGDGPGELRAPAALTVLGDTVLVADLRGSRVDRFTLDGAYLTRTAVELEECPGRRVHGFQAAGAPLLMLTCVTEQAHSEARVYRLGDEDPVLLARADVGDVEGRVINPFHVPMLAGGTEGFLLGILGDPCLHAFDPAGKPRAEICHPWEERIPVTPEERAKLMALQRRIPARTGLRIRVPDHLPPFDRVFLRPGGVVFRVLTGPDTRRLELLDGSGRLHRLTVPAGDRTFVGPQTVLTAREVMDGTEIVVVPLPD